MRRRDERPRVLGPSWNKARRRWRIRIIDPGKSEADSVDDTRWFKSEKDAQATKKELEAEFARRNSTTVEDAIRLYEQHLQDSGTIGYGETIRRLRLFFPELSRRLSLVTTE